MEAEPVVGGSERRRLWTTDEKRRIVEQTLGVGRLGGDDPRGAFTKGL